MWFGGTDVRDGSTFIVTLLLWEPIQEATPALRTEVYNRRRV